MWDRPVGQPGRICILRYVSTANIRHRVPIWESDACAYHAKGACMNRKISLGGAVTLAIMFSTVTFIMTMIYAEGKFNDKVFNLKERETMYAKLAEVDRLVRQNYYNAIDEDALNDSLIRGYVSGISDHYGLYLTAEQYADTMRDYDGKMVDIGILTSMDPGGYIRVEEVYTNSPAEVAGLMRDDLIVKVDELAVTADHYEAAVDALKGEPGTTVTLLVRHEGAEKSIPITRRKVEVLSASYRVIGDIGYIRIKEFNDNTPEQFDRALSQLINEEMVKALIFDVRGNPGGTIEAVGRMLDQLLPEGPIVSSTDRNNQTVVLYSSDANEVTIPMAVLINNKSASAAELFAQALKDYNKAKMVGVTTYGKGSMQKIYPLSDGSALDITVARYNPPVSPNYEGVGVKPDYEVKMTVDQEKEQENLDEQSDPQLKKAVEVVSALVKNQSSQQTPESVVLPSLPVPAKSTKAASSGRDGA
ncbi:MAG: S41 family peptidase [Oscillospiraceae bacterium]